MEKQPMITEKKIRPMSGYLALLLVFALAAAAVFTLIGAISCFDHYLDALGGILIMLFILMVVVFVILLCGFRVLNPKEALVLTLFGQYHGTITEPGFYYVNPFCGAVNPTAKPALQTAQTTSPTAGAASVTISTGADAGTSGKKVSLKTMTLDNGRQKVNDVLGNPIEIGAVVIWRVVNPTQAVFNVENYKTYLSIQCDSTIRNIARLYPYDLMDEDEDGEEKNEKTLRGSSQEIAEKMTLELQGRVADAGLEVEEVRITHLAYAPEIAAAMLQRQQATAIIAARQKIVEGAVGMVEMALNNLNEHNVLELDDERKAAMVSNLLVVLCGSKDAQPIVNSGSLY